ncbi:MAG: M16 family metallopeptidase [Ginsengibacter sp.]
MKKYLLPVLLMIPVAIFCQPQLPSGYFWQKLDNGLEVVVIENSKVPLATVEIAVKNGAFTEGPEYSGLSHLFEHMFFKANKEYPTQADILKRTQELGAIWNGSTGNERVNYYLTFNKDSLAQGMKFLNAAIRFPIYREEDMKRERPVVDGEFQRDESSPGFQLDYECEKRLWGDNFTRKWAIGIHNIINTATPAKMMIIKNKYYFPNNSILVIAGDVQHEEAFRLAKDIYGDWASSGFDPIVKFPIPEFAPLKSTQYFVTQNTIAKTPYSMYFWQGPDYRNDSAGTIAADVFSTILQLNSSKWQQALVDKGLATVANVRYQTAKYVGPIRIFVVPNPNKLKECNDEIMNQIKMWAQDDYFTDEELKEAKETLRRNDIRSREKPSQLPPQLTFQWCSTSLDYYTNYLDDCDKVTKEDIKNYVNKYITGKPYVAGLIINPEMYKQYQPDTFFKASL